MQKKLIALAVASLASGAAFAQTNVTMYGIVDAGYVYSQGDPASGTSGTNEFSGIQSGLLSGSLLGFKGEEALGNGLKAIFTLEYSLNIDNNSGIGNTGGLNARQQFVGLAGGFGTVALGRQYAPGYMATVNNSPAGGAAFEPASFLTAQAGNSITPNSGARWDNALTYTSPNFSGFTGKAIYSFGETSGAGGAAAGAAEGASNPDARRDNIWDNGSYGLGANFASGAFNVDAVWQSRTYRRGAVFDGDDTNEWYVGGSFDLKFVKLMASYQDQDDKNPLNNDNSTWQVGGVVPMGNANIHLGYAETDFDGLFDGKSQAFMVGMTYNLSKRTTGYAGYVWADNDNNSMPIAPVGGIGAVGQDNNTFLAGVRHSF
jgi:predicted porin